MAIRTPLKAIRAKCFDCCCGQFQEIKLCTVKDCPLYEYNRLYPVRQIERNSGKGIS